MADHSKNSADAMEADFGEQEAGEAAHCAEGTIAPLVKQEPPEETQADEPPVEPHQPRHG